MIKDSQKQTAATWEMERHWRRDVDWGRGCIKMNACSERHVQVGTLYTLLKDTEGYFKLSHPSLWFPFFLVDLTTVVLNTLSRSQLYFLRYIKWQVDEHFEKVIYKWRFREFRALYRLVVHWFTLSVNKVLFLSCMSSGKNAYSQQ